MKDWGGFYRGSGDPDRKGIIKFGDTNGERREKRG